MQEFIYRSKYSIKNINNSKYFQKNNDKYKLPKNISLNFLNIIIIYTKKIIGIF